MRRVKAFKRNPKLSTLMRAQWLGVEDLEFQDLGFLAVYFTDGFGSGNSALGFRARDVLDFSVYAVGTYS